MVFISFPLFNKRMEAKALQEKHLKICSINLTEYKTHSVSRRESRDKSNLPSGVRSLSSLSFTLSPPCKLSFVSNTYPFHISHVDSLHYSSASSISQMFLFYCSFSSPHFNIIKSLSPSSVRNQWAVVSTSKYASSCNALTIVCDVIIRYN